MSGFPIYLPYLPERTDFVMRHARTGLFMLDVQLGSSCNAKCPRCDSSCCDLDEPADIDLDALAALAAEIDRRRIAIGERDLPGGRNTGFICGLGEPTAARNLPKLKGILACTAPHHFCVVGIHKRHLLGC